MAARRLLGRRRLRDPGQAGDRGAHARRKRRGEYRAGQRHQREHLPIMRQHFGDFTTSPRLYDRHGMPIVET